MTIYSLSKRQVLTIGLQLSVFEWNLAILPRHIVQFAGDGVRHVAEVLHPLFVVLSRGSRRIFR